MTRIAFILASLSVLAHPCLCAADAHVGDPISVSGIGLPSPITGEYWGTSALPGFLDNGLPHIVGGTTLYGSSIFGPSIFVAVTSTAAADGLSGSVTIDYSSFFPGDNGIHIATIILKNDGTIRTASVLDGPAGTLNIIDGNSLRYTATGFALAVDPIVTIGWTQVPAPAGTAVLLMSWPIRRRRRVI